MVNIITYFHLSAGAYFASVIPNTLLYLMNLLRDYIYLHSIHKNPRCWGLELNKA